MKLILGSQTKSQSYNIKQLELNYKNNKTRKTICAKETHKELQIMEYHKSNNINEYKTHIL